MKQSKNHSLQKSILLLIAMLLIICISIALSACDDKNGKDDSKKPSDSFEDLVDGKFSIALDSIDSAQLNQVLTSALTYIQSHKDNIYGEIKGDYSADADIEYGYDNVVMEIDIDLEFYTYYVDDDNNDYTEKVCRLIFCKSDSDTTDLFNCLKEDYANEQNSPLIYAHNLGSLLVFENEQGMFEDIKNSNTANKSISEEQLKFFNTALKNGTAEDMEEAYFSYNYWYTTDIADLEYQNVNDNYYLYDNFDLRTWQHKGNREKQYICTNEPENNDINEFYNLDQCDSNSYAKESNGLYYKYTQPALGCHFRETVDKTGYAVDKYYYDNAPTEITIPATYKDKPVTELEFICTGELSDSLTNITIPESIKTIRNFPSYLFCLDIVNYQGTTESAKELLYNNWGRAYPSRMKVMSINCSDGDVRLTIIPKVRELSYIPFNSDVIFYSGTKDDWKKLILNYWREDLSNLDSVDRICCSDCVIYNPYRYTEQEIENIIEEFKTNSINSFSVIINLIDSTPYKYFVSKDYVYIKQEDDIAIYIKEDDWVYAIIPEKTNKVHYFKAQITDAEWSQVLDEEVSSKMFRHILDAPHSIIYWFTDIERNPHKPELPEEYRNYKELAEDADVER